MFALRFEPESDGTLTWDSTTVVSVEARGGGEVGLGWTYHAAAAATLVDDVLRDAVVGRDALDVEGAWAAMVVAIRNFGRPGIVSAAIAAVDVALWDLKARLLGVPLASLLGMVRDGVPVYGSGGFTSMAIGDVCAQLTGWVEHAAVQRVKMKIGTAWGGEEDRDVARAGEVRRALGDGVELFVDANGAYTRKQAARVASRLAELGVTWFEEPVSSDDLAGLSAVSAATALDVAAGEYGSDLAGFARLAPHVDVLQADVSRCAGITEWRRVGALAAAYGLDISGHCAQSLHLAVACHVPNVRHLEYFADHEHVDRLLFDGVPDPSGGVLRPDLNVAGHGMSLRADADEYRRG